MAEGLAGVDVSAWEFLANFFVNVGLWLRGVLLGWGITTLWAEVIVRTLGALVMAVVPLVITLFLIWESRKVIARMQDRIGPNNSGTAAGPYALFQSVADAIKIFTKELIFPEGVDLAVFVAAPMVVIAVAIAVWAVIPLGPPGVETPEGFLTPGMQVIDLDVGLFYVVSISSLAPFSMIMGGWSSRNKYADVGAFRAVSQIISYEIPQILALLVPVMLSGSLSLQDIIMAQQVPYILAVPVPALIYFLASTAEVGRLPFELAEADSEIVAGYSTEYSGMMFGAFYVGEFINNFAASVLFSILFLGGWRGPFVSQVPVLGGAWTLLKAFLVYNVFILFWAAMPRLRIDQVLAFNWKFMVPLGLVSLMVVAVVDKVVTLTGLAEANGVLTLSRAGWLLLANLVLAGGVVLVLVWVERYIKSRQQARRLQAFASAHAQHPVSTPHPLPERET